MLSREDNETLVRVGPQTPMGQFMRLYWIPFLKASDVTPDGQPYRVRLLGEDLVAFRDSSGRVGLVAQACPHRGAPLVFGRNEADGLRCVYHGWKFGVDGRCLDIPVEPAGSPMCKRMRVTAYAVRERNGMLWAYMGPEQENPPELPAVEWNLVPETQVAISMRIQECNWLQALEGEIDSAHAAILHGRVDVGGTINQWKQGADLTPTFECVQHDAGVSIGARRKTPDGQNYVRVNQFMLPFWTLVPPQAQFPDLSGHAWVPIDDEHTLCVMFSYTPAQPFYEKTRQVFRNGHAGRETGHHSEGAYERRPVTEPYHTYWSRFNRGNAYHFDYAQQVSKYNSGMPGLWIQDAACQSGVQPIYDRSQEHLGTSDAGIARTRRVLLEAVRQLQAGTPPVSAAQPGLFMKRAVSITIPAGGDWKELGAEHMRAEVGKDFGYQP